MNIKPYFSNNSSYQKVIDTLTYIRSKVIEAKYYTIKNLPDYVDFDEGVGGLSEQIMTWATADLTGSFESGNFGSNVDNERVESADIFLTNKMFYRNKWKKGLSYNIIDVQQANQAQVINLIEKKEEARKRNWDLGIQKTIFLGSSVNTKITGLLNNPDITFDTATITGKMADLTDQAFMALCTTLPNLFWNNSNKTAMFDTFIMPDDDFMALQMPASATFPVKTRFQYMTETLNAIARAYNGKDCNIMPCSYCNQLHNQLGQDNLGMNMYVLYRKDIDVLYYDMARDYTAMPFYTYNGFDFNNIAWGMYGGTNILRPQEVYYMGYRQA